MPIFRFNCMILALEGSLPAFLSKRCLSEICASSWHQRQYYNHREDSGTSGWYPSCLTQYPLYMCIWGWLLRVFHHFSYDTFPTSLVWYYELWVSINPKDPFVCPKKGINPLTLQSLRWGMGLGPSNLLESGRIWILRAMKHSALSIQHGIQVENLIIYVPNQLLILWIFIQTLIGAPYRDINSYYWVHDHPQQYEHDKSLDSNTYA